ncbi:hypothetical protein VTN00DRAFT_6244 [Thermoascus crustaceus]|uniref:uncharacterized protein n=1 Tax=Thermoascus crustaceus TaxID=5088 RepID=UPI0037429B76
MTNTSRFPDPGRTGRSRNTRVSVAFLSLSRYLIRPWPYDTFNQYLQQLGPGCNTGFRDKSTPYCICRTTANAWPILILGKPHGSQTARACPSLSISCSSWLFEDERSTMTGRAR